MELRHPDFSYEVDDKIGQIRSSFYHVFECLSMIKGHNFCFTKGINLTRSWLLRISTSPHVPS